MSAPQVHRECLPFPLYHISDIHSQHRTRSVPNPPSGFHTFPRCLLSGVTPVLTGYPTGPLGDVNPEPALFSRTTASVHATECARREATNQIPQDDVSIYLDVPSQVTVYSSSLYSAPIFAECARVPGFTKTGGSGS
ncbi:hypothetical protein CERSUDRAFT_87202 [Gelatoporia subvermispora B]|uniref:Uncharacterized protein n=1 Tax=Ceriporiopsis subvermispora (strain B) TaxID=914234 RepID=M2PCB3_CERS8|nr:hypothetical protein CERSUDRAFT_87202 [Gelatoporia subvermispora B]